MALAGRRPAYVAHELVPDTLHLTPHGERYILFIRGITAMTERRSIGFKKPTSQGIPGAAQFGHNSSPVSDSDTAKFDHWQGKKAVKKPISSPGTPNKGGTKPHNRIPSSK
jgi:hypothetical protein